MNTLSMLKFRGICFAIILAVAPLSAASHAQNIEDAVVVNVPFAFSDGSRNFAAGLYTIRVDDHKILAINGELGSGYVMTWFEEDSHPSKTTKVVFGKYGDQYFLHEIWIAGETTHSYCLPSKTEKREMAANETAPAVVVVAGLEMPR